MVIKWLNLTSSVKEHSKEFPRNERKVCIITFISYTIYAITAIFCSNTKSFMYCNKIYLLNFKVKISNWYYTLAFDIVIAYKSTYFHIFKIFSDFIRKYHYKIIVEILMWHIFIKKKKVFMKVGYTCCYNTNIALVLINCLCSKGYRCISLINLHLVFNRIS